MTHTRSRMALIAAAGVLAFGAAASGDIFYDEGLSGDISGDRLNPTAFSLVPGDNTLIGVLIGVDIEGNVDRDYFSVTVPAGYQLSELVHTDYISEDFGAFIAIESGAVFPIAPEDANPGNLLGWALFGPSTVGVDLLPTMGGNGTGFTAPLPAGTYSFWVQQTGEFTDYSLNFVVTEVPSPSAGLVLLGVIPFARRRR